MPVSPSRPITFVVCVNNYKQLTENLLASPCLQGLHPHQLIMMDQPPSVADAFHYGLQHAQHPVIVLVHQDVYLPENWDQQFYEKIEQAKTIWHNAGIFGLYGIGRSSDHTMSRVGSIYHQGVHLSGSEPVPKLVDSLDELLIAFPKETPLSMDKELGFHLYASDVILTARNMGLCAVVVDAPVHHNSLLNLGTASLAYWDKLADSCAHFESKWHDSFPYKTPSFLFLQESTLSQQIRRNRIRAEQTPALMCDLAVSDGALCAYPSSLNIGGGHQVLANYINIDINPACNPDLVLDLGQPLVLPKQVYTNRFGRFFMHKNGFKTISARGVLEHIPNLVTAMTNFLELLEPGGTLEILVPYDLSLEAWRNPTHCRAFNELSWLYYVESYHDLGWCEARFELIHLQFNLSSSGVQLRNSGLTQQELLHRVRAVDTMEVILKKVLLL
ncbi:MAG: class I SAM-dependent methyltransferase [Magnetococcus sp. YQC-5]